MLTRRNAGHISAVLGAALSGMFLSTALPETAAAESAGGYSQPNKLDIQYRDMGVILHATRVPFKTSAERFRRDIAADPNSTKPVADQRLTRAANSVGALVRGRSGPIDVAMTVLQPRGAKGSTCVISYRGTDREHKYDKSIKDRIRIKEGAIPLSVVGTTFRGTGQSCTLKDGYLQNYLETRGPVFRFLGDATNAGKCTRGVLLMGMSMGGATASVAFADLMMVRSLPVNQRVKSLIDAKKIWLVTAGAPRAVANSCASNLQRRAGDHVQRFIYGSHFRETEHHGSKTSCARFVDPVPGNPYMVQVGTRTRSTQHFGEAILGHNTFIGENPSTPPMKRAGRIRCRGLTRCQSKRFANAYARVSTRTAKFFFPNDAQYPRIGKDSGASCKAPGLVPAREYMFGRRHDTCSYRNMMAVYGAEYRGEAKRPNFKCPMPRDADDPSKHPRTTCPLGREAFGVTACTSQPLDVEQLHQR